jgi:UDP:flavonoid glycosyltransferase YjiC (YdhE family)
MSKVLFISGSIGLGHVYRDVAIAKELRKIRPDVEIVWLTEAPANIVLEQEGEVLHPDWKKLRSSNDIADSVKGEYSCDLTDFSIEWMKSFPDRVKVYQSVVKKEGIDLVVGDETYDIATEWYNHPKDYQHFPVVFLVDFVGFHHMSHDPKNMLGTYLINKMWCNVIRTKQPTWKDYIFLGQLEDVPDESFGLLLPNRRKVCQEHVDFVGYPLHFNPADYQDKEGIRERLGYQKELLVLVTVGGTSIGKPLLDLCSGAYSILKRAITELRMVQVTGPRIDPGTIPRNDGMDVRGYVPHLYEHMAAADVVITAGGGSTTLELAALNKPFIYFPLLDHMEQQHDVADRNARLRAGTKMDYATTTPDSLARAILDHLYRQVSYPPVPTNGARKAAELIKLQLK